MIEKTVQIYINTVII